MEPKLYKEFFSKLAEQLIAKFIAKELKPSANCLRIKEDLPIFDVLELLEKHSCLVIERGLVITRRQMMNKPVKILFYALIVEIEYRLYRALKPRVASVKELQTKELNDMIRLFLANEKLFLLQNIYTKKQDMKKDLKALSSFRNIIMHANKKMDLETEFKTILKRKRQAFKLLEALEQMYHKQI